MGLWMFQVNLDQLQGVSVSDRKDMFLVLHCKETNLETESTTVHDQDSPLALVVPPCVVPQQGRGSTKRKKEGGGRMGEKRGIEPPLAVWLCVPSVLF